MKVNGIVAEYNPFHNGHKYHLEQSKALTGADYTVVVLSGNFVQRGVPALLDKFKRTEMALLNGADLVLEIPAIFACSSAEYFASAAVSLLDKLGVVTNLCFGSEYGDIRPLQKAAKILQLESADFSSTLQYYLRRGMTYPTARAEALIQYDPGFAAYSNLFNHPNNILGIEYIKALLTFESSIEPITILRSGSAYNDPKPDTGYCSALAIRQSLIEGKSVSDLRDYLPKATATILEQAQKDENTILLDDLSSLLYYKLQIEKSQKYSQYMDVSNDLSDRIQNKLPQFTTYSAFCELLKTKELTYTRISRCLLHILLNITTEDILVGKELGYTPYARVLGFRKDATPLMHAIKRNSSIPLITKLADAYKLLGEEAMLMLNQDIQISQFYNGMASVRNQLPPKNEYTIPIVIV